MKCVKCNSEIDNDAHFCPYCGKAVEHGRLCVKCGKPLDDDSDYCPYCGTKLNRANKEPEQNRKVSQPQSPMITKKSYYDAYEEYPKEKLFHSGGSSQSSSCKHIKKDATIQTFQDKLFSNLWIMLVAAIIILGILIGGAYYYSNKDSIPSYVQKTNSIAKNEKVITSDIKSVEGIKSRLTDILSKALKMYDEDAINTYFSKEYRELFKKVNEYDSKYVHDEPGFWCGNIWDGGQDGNPNSAEIIQISSSSDTYAYAQVKFIHQEGDYKSKVIQSMNLIFENGDWRIADIGDYKSSMKEYLSNSNEKKDIIDAYSKILDDFAIKGKNSTNGNFYFLHDINGGGIPELWVQVCNDEITCELLIYEYKYGATSKIYQEGVGHIAHHSFVIVKDCVCLSYAHMGSVSIAEYVYNNGKIQTKEIYSREAYNEEDSDEPKGTEIETYEITDKKPLANI